MNNKATLYDIIDRAKWREFQDHFANVLGVTLATIDSQGHIIAEVSTQSSLREEVKQTLATIIIKEKGIFVLDDTVALQRTWRDGLKSPSGFYYFLIPMKVVDTVLAYVMVGPVVIGRSLLNMRAQENAQQLSLDESIFSQAVEALKTFTFYEITATIDLISDVANHALELEHQNKTLRSLGPEASDLFKKVYGWYADKLYTVLLDVALDLIHAERGSLMLLDEEKKELYIKHARGISDDVIKKTHIKLGEGIAGMVALEGTSFIIDREFADERIRPFLHQPELNSAIAMPFTINNRIKGVLNVSTQQATRGKFTSASVESLDKLIRLVGVTIGDLARLATA